MPTLLLVSHTPSDNTLALRNACVNGITHPDLDNITLISKSFQDTHSEDVLNCDGIMLVTTENFGSMAKVSHLHYVLEQVKTVLVRNEKLKVSPLV